MRPTMSIYLCSAALSALIAAVPLVAAADAAPKPPAMTTSGDAMGIDAALADTTRPQEDRDADARRHPKELIEFAGIKPGDKVVDFLPGKGYFTRLFADVVGPQGHVYAFVPAAAAKVEKMGDAATTAVQGRANASVAIDPLLAPTSFDQVDVIWTSQNYHDLHTKMTAGLDIAKFNKMVFDKLKPGGVFVVVDHVAKTGSGLEACEKYHRIDPAIVKQEVEAAGFKFDGESNVLANPADPHDVLVFDPSIRGKTDQFAFRFKKPAA